MKHRMANFRYSNNFERDFMWYLSVRHDFTFSGDVLRSKSGEELNIVFDRNGVSGKSAFHTYDSQGKLLPTKHPRLLHCLLKTKASVNFQVREWAKDRAAGYLPIEIFNDICFEYKLPHWVVTAVENQKLKYYP